ncbi:DUF2155 domain-containing protein [Commensalibacter papalotli (ex Botero et al. 2024)]|uniref:DUF2155 domain n=1 Tax=Commensalibacter papalotli (ex Botero et al. 2024) TaxID=2972766 RepID=A0ABM9HSV7_9PROT|nr:DUF2155 domain-containing protein [Commensalibacter papalotli (ex Botero et al. 2024)]CAI3952782.1 DUF2155 domain [Commensalibacter papalotli (ex Botero et al. 2024)]CAI3953301.1 DUF2155 domain [Commensalibacter papalotli (ex Botero et al. 2024)]
MKKFLLALSMCSFFLVEMNAYADPPAANTSDLNKQPVTHVDNTWYSQPKAEIRILNKLESSVTNLTIPVGGSAQYKTLTVAVKKCIVRPITASPDSAAFVTVTDSQLPTNPFAAWIFVAEPGASVFEHPLYNVSIVGCTGEIDKNPIVTKPSSVPATEQKGQGSPNDLEQSLERSIQSQH